MKREADHNDDAFERKLAGFQRSRPPEEWRDELIANALPIAPASEPRVTRRSVFDFKPLEKILGGTLAAAWIAIFGLWTATPDDAPFAGTNSLEEEGGSLQSNQFPMIAWRFAGNEFDDDEILP